MYLWWRYKVLIWCNKFCHISCYFILQAGPSGSQFGVMACLLVEMLQSYQMYRRPGLAIMKLVTPILVLFFFGLLPWFDNWAHLFGFGFGFLLAFALMPYVSFGKFDRRRKLISVLVALGSAFGLFMLLILLFYIVPLTECSACQYFNCIPFTATFCENMQVSLKKNSTYSAIWNISVYTVLYQISVFVNGYLLFLKTICFVIPLSCMCFLKVNHSHIDGVWCSTKFL